MYHRIGLYLIVLGCYAVVFVGSGIERVDARQVNALACMQTNEVPVLDAILDDACWQATASARGFSQLGTGGYQLATRQTQARFAYDAAFLYVAVECFSSGQNEIIAKPTNRDGPVFDSDCVEIFLGSDTNGASDANGTNGIKDDGYTHYVINALGNYYDARDNDRTWDSKITVATRRYDDRWVLEAAIPFSELEKRSPQSGDTWTFNVAREHRHLDQPVAFSTWSTLGGSSFHTPRDFSLLRFFNKTIPNELRQVTNVRKPLTPGFKPLDDGDSTYAWKLSPHATRQAEVYLSDVYIVRSDRRGLIASQAMNDFPLQGARVQVSVDAKGTQGATLGMIARYETEDGQVSEFPMFWDQALADRFTRTPYTITFPPNAHRLLAIDLHHSNGLGEVYCRHVNLDVLSDAYDGIKDPTDTMADYRIPVGEPAPSIDAIPWAPSLPGGPIRALVIIESRIQRGAEELAQRLDMEYELVWLSQGSYFSYDAQQINARLRRETTPYDVILASGDIEDRALIRILEKNIASGTGMICLAGEKGWSALQQRLTWLADTHRLDVNQKPEVLKFVPWEYFPTVPDNYIEGVNPSEPAIKSLGISTYQKGRVVSLVYGSPAGIYDGLLPHVGLNRTSLAHWWEYNYSLLAKLILFASGREPVAKITDINVAPSQDRIHVTIAANGDTAGNLTVQWPTYAGESQKEIQVIPVKVLGEGSATATIEVPAEIRNMHGMHVANIFLTNDDQETLDWATTTWDVHSSIRMATPNPFDNWESQDGSSLQGIIHIHDDRHDSSRPKPNTLHVQMCLVDANGRLVWEQTKLVVLDKSGKTKVVVMPSIDRSVTLGHELVVTLRDADGVVDGVVDCRRWPIHVAGLWDEHLDDFRAGLYGDFYRRTHTDDVFTHWVQTMGFDFVVEQGEFQDAPRLNMPWYDSGVAISAFHHRKGVVAESQRQPCLSDPEAFAEIQQKAVRSAGRSLQSGALLISMADEAELVKDGLVELCYGPHCRDAFRVWSQKKYQQLDRLNDQWGTALQTWKEVEPVTAEHARQRGEYSQWVDFRTFMEDVWVGAYVKIKGAILEKYPKARISLSNPFYLNPFSGSDHEKLSRHEDFFGKYMRPDLIKEYRSFNSSALMQTHWGYLEDIDSCRWYPWYFAFHGGDLMNFYDCVSHRSNYDLFDGTYRHTRRSQAIVDVQQDLTHGVGKILHDATPAKNQVAVLYSQNSMKVAWIESDAKVGQEIWDHRVMEKLPVSNSFALFTKTMASVKFMIKETGLQPDFITPNMIMNGKLNDYRILILPGSLALSDEALEVLAAYVKAGGTVVAGMRTAMFNEDGKRMPSREVFERLFGLQRVNDGYTTRPARVVFAKTKASHSDRSLVEITSSAHENIKQTTADIIAGYDNETPAITVNQYGTGRAIYLNLFAGPSLALQHITREILEIAGVEPRVGLSRDGVRPLGYETFEWEREAVTYVCLLRDMAPQGKTKSVWFGPEFHQAISSQEQIHVTLAQRVHVYDVRQGEYLGLRDTLDIAFAPGEAKVFALLPYGVADIQVNRFGRNVFVQGDSVSFRINVEAKDGSPLADHVVRIEIRDSDNRIVSNYSRNILAENGVYSGAIPLALNDKPGVWTMQVTDVISGMSSISKFDVTSRPSSINPR